MAPKKIYTIKNPDPNPILELVEDPEKTLEKEEILEWYRYFSK